MRNPTNCGLPDGFVHAHTDRCHQAGIQIGTEQGRAQERAQIVAWLRDQAALHHHGAGDAARRGALNAAADRIETGREVGRP